MANGLFLCTIFSHQRERALLSERSLVIGWRPLLLARSTLLRSPSLPAALFRRARFMAPDTALQLLGTWAQLQADQVPRITLDYYDENRRALRWTSQMLTWQQAGQYQALDEQFLTMPDGSCALPVAYILAYAHFSQGKIRQWIDRLDAVLENPALTGDTRVNWLIARAHAQEIRRAPGGRHFLSLERLLGGIEYLNEASLVAQSPAAQLRVHGEMIARFGAQQRVDVANQLVAQASSKLSGPGVTKQVTTWQAELESLGTQIAQRRAAQEALAQQAYLDRLRARYQKAVTRKDETNAARYRNLLNQAGAPLQ